MLNLGYGMIYDNTKGWGGCAAFSFCFSAATISEMGNGGKKGGFCVLEHVAEYLKTQRTDSTLYCF